MLVCQKQEPVKREAGLNPARSRHCVWEVFAMYATGFFWEGLAKVMILQSGNLPFIIVQEEIPGHEQLIVLCHAEQQAKCVDNCPEFL